MLTFTAMDNLLGSIQAIPRRTGLSSGVIGLLLGISILCLGGFLFSYTLSLDDELTLIDVSGSIDWHYQVGRFMLGLFRRGFWPNTHPFIAYAVLAFAYVTSYALLLGIHNLRHSWMTTMSFILFIGFPTNWLVQEFLVTAYSLAFGLVLAPVAAIETLRLHARTSSAVGPRYNLPSPAIIVFLVVLTGFFQSFILLYLSIGIACPLLDGDRKPEKTSKQLRALPHFLIYGAIAIILHQLAYKFLLLIKGLQPAHLDQYTNNTLGMIMMKPLHYLLGHGSQITLSYLHPGLTYGTALWALPLLLAGSLLSLWMARTRSAEVSPLAQAGLILLLLVSPFLLNVLSTPNTLPLRAYTSFPYVVWALAMLWMLNARRQWRGIFFASVLMTGLLAFQCLDTLSQYFFIRQYNARADMFTASMLASSMVNRPEFSGKEHLRLVTHGRLQRRSIHGGGAAWSSAAPGSFFLWGEGNASPLRIVAYLRTLGISTIEVADAATRAQFWDQFHTMRTWPDPQSLRLKGDVLLLKLSADSTPSSGP